MGASLTQTMRPYSQRAGHAYMCCNADDDEDEDRPLDQDEMRSEDTNDAQDDVPYDNDADEAQPEDQDANAEATDFYRLQAVGDDYMPSVRSLIPFFVMLFTCCLYALFGECYIPRVRSFGCCCHRGWQRWVCFADWCQHWCSLTVVADAAQAT